MWTWVDGHLLLVWVLCPFVAYGVVGWWNARTVRRCQKRRELLHNRGAR